MLLSPTNNYRPNSRQFNRKLNLKQQGQGLDLPSATYFFLDKKAGKKSEDYSRS
jgi:hypothetical protein